jgi:XTP/dITP diphosphohydrolase
MLLIATTNPGKVREFRQLLAAIVPADQFTDLSQFPKAESVPETGSTFLANACLKASGYARQVNLWSLADDSGLAVDALDGKPGVFSARWAAQHKQGTGDQANNTLLLDQIKNIPDEKRTARFICSLALANPAGKIILTATDTVEGRLLRAPRGTGGFGYDPLFLIPSLNKTTAELPAEQKHQISHRGKALRRLAALIARLSTPGRPALPFGLWH